MIEYLNVNLRRKRVCVGDVDIFVKALVAERGMSGDVCRKTGKTTKVSRQQVDRLDSSLRRFYAQRHAIDRDGREKGGKQMVQLTKEIANSSCMQRKAKKRKERKEVTIRFLSSLVSLPA